MVEENKRFYRDGFYKTAEWCKARNHVKKHKINTRCSLCGEPLLRTQKLLVDHIIPRRKLPKSRWLDVSNLQLVHYTCHSSSKKIIENNDHKNPVGIDGINSDWK